MIEFTDDEIRDLEFIHTEINVIRKFFQTHRELEEKNEHLKHCHFNIFLAHTDLNQAGIISN